MPTGCCCSSNVDEAEIARRRAAWTQPAPRYTRGVLAKFARNASSASTGAVLDRRLSERLRSRPAPRLRAAAVPAGVGGTPGASLSASVLSADDRRAASLARRA